MYNIIEGIEELAQETKPENKAVDVGKKEKRVAVKHAKSKGSINI